MESLSSVEKYFYHRSKLGYHSCFFLAVKLYKAPEDGEICNALKQTISKHPQLYSNVSNENGSLALNPLKQPIHFKDVMKGLAEESLSEDVVNRIFQDINFDYGVEKPLWTILVLKDRRTFIFCTDHVIMDGLSAVAFWKSFMSSLNSSQPLEISDDVVYKPNAQNPRVPQHPYDRLPFSLLGFVLRIFVQFLILLTFVKVNLIGTIFAPSLKDKDFKFKDYQFPQGLLTDQGAIRNDNNQVNLHVSPSKLRTLLQNCKKHKLSLTALLPAIIAHSLTSVPDSKIEGSHMRINVPMNTRTMIERIMAIDSKFTQCGNFVKGGELTCDRSQLGQLWQTAAKFGTQLAAQRYDHSSLQLLRLLDLIDVEEYIKTKIGAKYPSSTFEVTNLGYESFSCGEDDAYIVEDAYFNEPQGLSDIFTCSMVATPFGGLNCWFSYPKTLSEDLGIVIYSIQTTLKALSESPSS
ncbi:LANO_0F15830g1_1 [Lachancea nothofagi CBS 11611]|uniref:LANO_0F15830g1_1 n=1 Tax=Lachancea nothofagi CBS 11611 TaxID=1266666 RepID=A0A1G4KCR2_9SACH|nr:LANO_0F15830g1_1 [Lachancea nothofagi CBS 11611]